MQWEVEKNAKKAEALDHAASGKVSAF